MKYRMTCISLCMVGAMFLAGCMSQGGNPEQMIAEANALDQKFFEMYNNSDVDGIMALYWKSPDVVSYPPGELEIRGWDAIKEGFEKDFGSGQVGKLELMESSNTVAGDVVIGMGKWRYSIPDPPMEIIGRYTDVKAKKDGKWVYTHDHASMPMPPPAN
jgi:ketosteroid isomerase-like protein